ncbi:MAG: hypothetical protein H0X43_13985 [Nitrosospira sp.]|nr:hypothetical protein [Nitrosospira sp.]
MYGRFEQSGTRRYYISPLGANTSDHVKWLGDHIPSLMLRQFMSLDDHQRDVVGYGTNVKARMERAFRTS